MSGFISGRSSGVSLYSLWWQATGNVIGGTANTSTWAVAQLATGTYQVTHNLGFTFLYQYASWGSIQDNAPIGAMYKIGQNVNTCNVYTFDQTGFLADFAFAFVLFPFA